MGHVSPTASHSVTIRIRLVNKPGMLARAIGAIAELKGDPGAIDVVSSSKEFKVRDITISARDDALPVPPTAARSTMRSTVTGN